MHDENSTILYLFYTDMAVPTHEEYLLYDFNAIVSAVGGSLGLFLGFSCYEIVKMCLNKVSGDKKSGVGDESGEQENGWEGRNGVTSNATESRDTLKLETFPE